MGACGSRSSRYSSVDSGTSAGKSRVVQMKRKRKKERNYTVDHSLNKDNVIKIRGKVGNLNIVYNGKRSSDPCVYRRRKEDKEFCSVYEVIDGYTPTTEDHLSSLSSRSSDDDESLESLSQQTTITDKNDKVFTKSLQSERPSKRCSFASFPGACLFSVEKIMPSVCNIELNGKTLGTGFRIGSHFVMTAYSVLEYCIDGCRLAQYCKARFPSCGDFSFANIEFVDIQNDVLILSLQCHDDKILPAPLTLSEASEDSDSVVYITQNPSTASGRSGSPGIVLDKNGQPVVTVMHIESSFKSETAGFHNTRQPIVCCHNWFVKVSNRDYSDHYSSMTMKHFAQLLNDCGHRALKEKCFSDAYNNNDTETFCERYCYKDKFMMVVGSAGCGKSSFIKTLADSWEPDKDSHYPDIVVFVFAASDSDALPTDEIKQVLSQYKQNGPHIYGIMTKMDLVTEDEITKDKRNQVMSLLGLREDSFSYWINKDPSNDKVNAADNTNPVVVRIENDMEKLKEVIKKHCTTNSAEEFESEESFKDIQKMSPDLPRAAKLDPSEFEDHGYYTEDRSWEVVQESQQSSTNSTFSTYDCNNPACNGMQRQKILPDGENNDICLMQQQIETGECDETRVKSSSVRHIQPVCQTGKVLMCEDSDTLSRNQTYTVGYCYTSVCTEQSKTPGTMCISVSNFTKDISSDDEKNHFSQAKYTHVTATLSMLADRKLNGPESSMPYVSKQQETSLICEEDKAENFSMVYHLEKLKIAPRKGINEIFCDRALDVEMFCNDFFNIKMKEECEFMSVHPEEEIQATTLQVVDVNDSCFEDTDEITSDDCNNVGSKIETKEVEKPLNCAAEVMDFSQSKKILERLRRLINVRQDFTSVKWTRFYVNPAPKNTQPSNLFGSQERSQNAVTPAHTEENENHTSDPRIAHGLNRNEQISSRITSSSIQRPREQHPQTQSPDSSVISGSTGILDSFSTNASSSMNGLLSSLRSGSQDEVLRYEWGRFRTFWSYPLDCPVNPTNLARRGWFYEGNGDETVCFSCKVRHAHWRMGEDIDARHAQISPHCPFINGQDCGNVPIHGNPTPSVPANFSQGAVGGASSVDNSACSNTRVDHEPTSLLTRNLQLSGGRDPNTPSSFVQQGTGSAQLVTRTPATASQHKSTVNRSSDAGTPSASTSGGTATGNVAANSARLVAQPTSTPAIFLQTSVPSTPTVNQTPGSAPIRTDFQPQPQANSKHSQPPSNQHHPTTQRQVIEERQRQAQRRQEEMQRSERQQGNQQPTNSTALGINTERPRYPNYAIVTVRAGTFGGFPTYLDQTPMQMAKAGFFYAGYGDYVRCFFCGGGLRNWEPGDDPWVEHARWFPRCTFVKQNKGQAFINLVLQRQRELLLPNISVPTEAQPQLPQAGVPHSVDLQSSAVQSIKEMGYSDSKIQRAVVRFRAQRGHDIPLTAQSLLEILFTLTTEDEEAEATIDVPPGIIQSNQSQGTPSQSIPSHSQTQSQTSQNQSQGQTQNNPQAPSVDKDQDQTKTSSPSQQRQQPATVGQEASSSGKQATVELSASGALPDDDQSRVFSVEELRSIQDENMALKEQMKCKICMDNTVSISFLPCGHLCCCAECAPAMVRCPICRHIIKGSVKTYLS